MNRVALFLLVTTIIAIACDEEPTSVLVPGAGENLTGISQGIYGTVRFWEGDFMPTFPEDDSGGRIYPVERDVCIFEAVLYHDIQWSYVEIEPGIYAHLAADVPAVLVDVVHSGENGYFEAELPEGRYSIFVREGGYYYANLVDGGGYVFPADVVEGEKVGVNFDITYMATF